MPFLRWVTLATILLHLTNPCFGKESPWKTLAMADLEEIRKAINENHPGVVDEKNPYFKAWFDRGYQEADLPG